jgi:hypothetical protein
MRTGSAHELEEVTWPSSTLARLFSTDTSTMTPASAVNDLAVGAVAFRRRRRRIEDRINATNLLMTVDLEHGSVRVRCRAGVTSDFGAYSVPGNHA